VLVAYYSRSGFTRALAERIHGAVGGDLVEILPVVPYPDDYRAVVERGRLELESGRPPAVEAPVGDLSRYGVVFVGSPNWFSTVAPPVRAFLSGHDLSGKTVVPFVTHGGSGMARCVEDLRRICPASAVPEGLAVRDVEVGSSGGDVSGWLRTVPPLDRIAGR
jgi:flavodoxin